jgi:hypothetical protein
MRRASYLIVFALAGCESESSVLDREAAHLATLAFDVPAGWLRTDTTRRGVASAEWKPEDNERGESLVIVRTELAPAVAKAGIDQLERLLDSAQRSLAKRRTRNLSPIVTPRGLPGARVDVAFDRPGSADRLHRTHVVLAEADGASLIHVLYTAKQPDEARVALNMVLDSLRAEEQ